MLFCLGPLSHQIISVLLQGLICGQCLLLTAQSVTHKSSLNSKGFQLLFHDSEFVLLFPDVSCILDRVFAPDIFNLFLQSFHDSFLFMQLSLDLLDSWLSCWSLFFFPFFDLELLDLSLQSIEFCIEMLILMNKLQSVVLPDFFFTGTQHQLYNVPKNHSHAKPLNKTN